MAWLIGILFIGGGLSLMIFRRAVKDTVNSDANPLVKVQLATMLFGSPFMFLIGIFIIYQKFNFIFDQRNKFVDWCLTERGITNYTVVSVEKDVLANYATVRLYDTDTNQSTTCYPWVAEIQ